LQFDNAVVFVGETIEAAAQELIKVGPDDRPEWKPKYTMKELLNPEFKLPTGDESGVDDLEALIETGHVHGLKYDEVR
jgi:hypothetical protein